MPKTVKFIGLVGGSPFREIFSPKINQACFSCVIDAHLFLIPSDLQKIKTDKHDLECGD